MRVSTSVALVYLARLSNRRKGVKQFYLHGWVFTYIEFGGNVLSFEHQMKERVHTNQEYYGDNVISMECFKITPTSNDALLCVNCGDRKCGRNALKKTSK